MARNNEYESGFARFMNKVGDCVFATVLWLVFCIPVITIGASTSALFTVVRRVRKGTGGKVWESFRDAFRGNFRPATLSWLVQLILMVVLYIDHRIMLRALEQKSPLGFLYNVFYYLILVVGVWALYSAAYVSRFALNAKRILKKSLVLAVVNLPVSFLMFVLFVAAYRIAVYLPFTLFLFPVLFVWIFQIFLERIFRRAMSEEELQKLNEEEH